MANKQYNISLQVGAGLDSQILGDYEIVGQIKKAVKFSKEHQCMGGYMERLVNAVLQASKEIKTNTLLSGGTVSVSFAAVQYIRELFPAINDKKIALLGIGKIGKNTCKNLVDYLDTRNIVLVNRTNSKASELANEMGIQSAPYEEMEDIVASADIIIVATNSQNPVITKKQLTNSSHKLILDLSIPYNVESSSNELPNIQLVNVDELSKIKDSNLLKRQAEMPKALTIIEKFREEFIEWHKYRRNVPVLKAIKTKLEQLHQCDIFISYSAKYRNAPVYKNKEKIQKLVNGLAVKMKEHNQQGCYYLEALNEFIATA
jgi:glutamyl-tRNA reductase